MIKIAAMVGAPDLEKETLAVYSKDLPVAFEKLAALGYEGIELMMKNPDKLDGGNIRRLLDASGMKLVGLCTGHVFGEDKLGLVGPDASKCSEAMARLKGFVEFGGRHFGEGTFVNIGRARGMGYADDNTRTLDNMAERFGELADHAAQFGVRIVLEPITVNQTNYIITTQDGLEMVERVRRENFGLMLDVYHMNIEDDNINESFQQARDKCWFIHFTDSNRKYPGSAHLDFEKIIETLNNIGFDGYVSMEILPLPDPDTAARSAITFLRKYIPVA
jgi:sugar phosphate isomerase/epimerase